jgi:hypothetical protein
MFIIGLIYFIAAVYSRSLSLTTMFQITKKKSLENLDFQLHQKL